MDSLLDHGISWIASIVVSTMDHSITLHNAPSITSSTCLTEHTFFTLVFCMGHGAIMAEAAAMTRRTCLDPLLDHSISWIASVVVTAHGTAAHNAPSTTTNARHAEHTFFSPGFCMGHGAIVAETTASA